MAGDHAKRNIDARLKASLNNSLRQPLDVIRKANNGGGTVALHRLNLLDRRRIAGLFQRGRTWLP